MPWAALTSFLAQAVVISMSGVMAPGPVTAVAIGMGQRRRHAGAWIAVGHGIVEFPLMVLIVVGLGRVFEIAGVRIAIGLAGGAMLLWMGAQMVRASRRTAAAVPAAARRGPVVTGIVLSAGNPYFLLWWATVGLALASRAAELGIVAFALFAILHWLCDFAWLEALSWTSFTGSRLLGGRAERIVLAVCGVALIVFAVLFFYRAGRDLAGPRSEPAAGKPTETETRKPSTRLMGFSALTGGGPPGRLCPARGSVHSGHDGRPA